MWLDNGVFREDLEACAAASFIPWEEFKDKTVLITGSTGLIGFTMVCSLLYANIKHNLNMKIVALVRNMNKAQKMFTKQLEEKLPLVLLEGTVEDLPEITETIDYIIHGANPTSSSYFLEKPVETIQTGVFGTDNLLKLARAHNVKGFVFLSSLEVYGTPTAEKILEETMESYINLMLARSSYPESKRLSEMLCTAYYYEYGVPARSVRLAQTFGPGVLMDDMRVFAEFSRCVVEGRDIVLKTEGKTRRQYVYTMDAITAILTVLLKGESAQSYNVANQETFCSIREMAEMVANKIAKGTISVRIELKPEETNKYLATNYLNMSTDKIESLGWEPKYNLVDMYSRMIKVMK